MARARRRPDSSLKTDVFERPQAYQLFQALRLIEALAAREAMEAGLPAPDPIGRGFDPRSASLRIRSAVPLGFAASEVVSVRQPRNGGPLEVTQTVVGLTGPSGVLPHAFSELVQVSVRERNFGLREFFDLFNNRLAGLLFDAWAKYRLPVERERSDRLGATGVIDSALRALVGIGSPGLKARTATPDSSYVRFGGLLAREARSAHAVERVLSGSFGHPVAVEQFCGEWLAISVPDRTRLPARDAPEGHFARLGSDSVVGARAYDVQSTVRLVIGPLDYAAFRSLLPDGSNAGKLRDLAAMALGPEKAIRIRLRLKAPEVPAARLAKGEPGPDPAAGRLGWNTWLVASGPRRIDGEVEFRPPAHLR